MNELIKMNVVNVDKVDNKILFLSKLLVQKNFVKLDYNSDDEIKAKFPYKICDLGVKGSNYLLDNLLDYETNENKCFLKIIDSTKLYDLTKPCKNKKCNFESCPLMIAAYFQNLCDNDPTLKNDIESINSVKSELELQEMINSIIAQTEIKIQLNGLLKLYKKKKIINKVKDETQFYNNFALIGNQGLEQDKIVSIIKSILISNQAISDSQFEEFYSLDLEFDKMPSKPNLSDYENLIIEKLKKYKLIYLRDFDKIITLKTKKEDFYYKLINTIKKLIIDDTTQIIFIISGTKEKIKLIFNENTEFSSLFGYKWELEDYDIDTLATILIAKFNETGINSTITHNDLIQKLNDLYRESNFKNSYFIDEIYQKTLKNFYEKDSNILNIDLLPTMKKAISLDDTMKEINELIGMKKIKNELNNLSKFLMYNKRLEKINGIKKTLNLHMVFSGNAGTGKTTVARLLADIFYNMGYIEERKITEITPKDLIGEYTGQTAPKARKTIENALGGILFIDEAYSLKNSKNGFGADAIVELLKCMEDYQDRIVIIFAGYHNEMNDFIGLNPGLKSRIRYYFEFDDYNEDELIQILKLKFRKLKINITTDAIKTLKRIISFNIKATNFGNGRYVDNLVNNLLVKHSLNISDKDDNNLLTITLDDVNSLSETNEIKIDDIFEKLNKLVGLNNIKKDLYQLVDYLEYNKKLEKFNIYPKNINLHMIFSGNAGTGKTTVARLLADIFYSLGYIPENRLTEVTSKDLTGEYVGQTAPKVKRLIENALGGVLFIDEAYSLGQRYSGSNGYGREAITELLIAMEKYYDRLIIVFSGYEKEMKDFINSNPGLKSRIGKSFVFEDYTVDELADILLKFVDDNKLKITDKALEKFKKLIETSIKTKNFGNARWVRNSFDRILLKHSTNTKNFEDQEKLITITEDDIDIQQMKKLQNTTKNKFGFDIEKKAEKLINNNYEDLNEIDEFVVDDFEEVDKL